MWFYLFASNEKYPDPESEIKSLAELDEGGERVYLKLSSRDDAPMKNAQEGETVYLCTRQDGRWRGARRCGVGRRPRTRGNARIDVVHLWNHRSAKLVETSSKSDSLSGTEG